MIKIWAVGIVISVFHVSHNADTGFVSNSPYIVASSSMLRSQITKTFGQNVKQQHFGYLCIIDHLCDVM